MFTGLHTHIPVELFGVQRTHRYNQLWWTIYIMDRYISSSTGCPMIIHDEDVTTALPSTSSDSQEDVVFALRVKTARLMSKVLRCMWT